MISTSRHFIEGFVEQCYAQGLHEKQASTLLRAAQQRELHAMVEGGELEKQAGLAKWISPVAKATGAALSKLRPSSWVRWVPNSLGKSIPKAPKMLDRVLKGGTILGGLGLVGYGGKLVTDDIQAKGPDGPDDLVGRVVDRWRGDGVDVSDLSKYDEQELVPIGGGASNGSASAREGGSGYTGLASDEAMDAERYRQENSDYITGKPLGEGWGATYSRPDAGGTIAGAAMSQQKYSPGAGGTGVGATTPQQKSVSRKEPKYLVTARNNLKKAERDLAAIRDKQDPNMPEWERNEQMDKAIIAWNEAKTELNASNARLEKEVNRQLAAHRRELARRTAELARVNQGIEAQRGVRPYLPGWGGVSHVVNRGASWIGLQPTREDLEEREKKKALLQKAIQGKERDISSLQEQYQQLFGGR